MYYGRFSRGHPSVLELIVTHGLFSRGRPSVLELTEIEGERKRRNRGGGGEEFKETTAATRGHVRTGESAWIGAGQHAWRRRRSR
jgi:hypothetical protein